MATVSWTGSSGNWTNGADWSNGTGPGPADDAVLSGSGFYIVSLTTPVAVNSIALQNGEATLAIDDPGGTDTVSAGLDIAFGSVDIDQADSGGSTVDIGGTITVVSGFASLTIGNLNSPDTAATTVTAGGLAGGGSVTLAGGGGAAIPALTTLDITSAAPAVWSGGLTLDGNAVLEFANGNITENTGDISVQGGGNFIADAGNPAGDDAIAGLTENANELLLQNGGQLAISGNLTNTGRIDLDDEGGHGGSLLTIGGTLTNDNIIEIGNSAMSAPSVLSAAALADLGGQLELEGGTSGGLAAAVFAGVAPDALTGFVSMDGNSLLQFASGSITSVSSGTLFLGPGALIEDAGTSGDTALSGLASIVGAVQFGDVNLVTSTGLTVVSGSFDIDAGLSFGSTGGSTVAIGGALTVADGGSVAIGASFGNNSGSTAVSAAGLALASGSLVVVNGGANGSGLLDIASAAPASFSAGDLQVDGNAAVVFDGGTVGAIGAGAELLLDGAGAIEDAGTSGDTALAGLTLNAGSLELQDTSVAISGSLENTSTGFIELDINTAAGGSTLTIAGALTFDAPGNGSVAGIDIGNFDLSAPTTVSAAALVNAGKINIDGGSGSDTNAATLAITGAAPSVLSGTVDIGERGTLMFGSGAVAGIAAGASLELDGIAAGIAVSSGGGTVNALAGLALNAGTLTLGDGASLSIGAAGFTNSGSVAIDPNPSLFLTTGLGGSTLTIAGSLANAGTIAVGNSGNGGASALIVSGGISGSGTVSLAHSGTLVLVDGAVASGQTIDFTTANGTVGLADPAQFAGTIAGLPVGGSITVPSGEIDLTTVAYGSIASATLNAATDQINVALAGGDGFAIQLTGSYASGTIVETASDQNGGTDLFLRTAPAPQPYAAQDPLMTNTAGALVFDQVVGTQMVFTAIGGLGPEWEFDGAGSFLASNTAGFMIRDTGSVEPGAVFVGSVVGSSVQFTPVGGLGLEWQFEGDADFLGNNTIGIGQSQFLIHNTGTLEPGALVLGQVDHGIGGVSLGFTSLGGLGLEWEFDGTGDFLGDGNQGFLIRNDGSVEPGALDVGEIANGTVNYTPIGGVGPEWDFEGTGDFLGDGHTGFLIWNSGTVDPGALAIGEVVNGSLQFTDIGGLGSEWQFVGTGNYVDSNKTDFLLRNTGTVDSGALVVGSVSGATGNATVNYTLIGGVGPEWSFQNTSPALMA